MSSLQHDNYVLRLREETMTAYSSVSAMMKLALEMDKRMGEAEKAAREEKKEKDHQLMNQLRREKRRKQAEEEQEKKKLKAQFISGELDYEKWKSIENHKTIEPHHEATHVKFSLGLTYRAERWMEDHDILLREHNVSALRTNSALALNEVTNGCVDYRIKKGVALSQVHTVALLMATEAGGKLNDAAGALDDLMLIDTASSFSQKCEVIDTTTEEKKRGKFHKFKKWMGRVFKRLRCC